MSGFIRIDNSRSGMLKICVAGSCGKMGKRIISLAMDDPGIKIVSALEAEGASEIGKDIGGIISGVPSGVVVTDDITAACSDIDCVIDFTLPEPTLEHVAFCVEKGVAMVIGTTGFDASGDDRIREASTRIPVVFSPNMAVGVNVLFKMVAEAARVLGKDFSINIDETHHVHKKDSPSGTARMIAGVVRSSCGMEPEIKAFREGEVVGNHGIVFDGEFERIEIRHEAKTRDVFASGALDAARFIKDKPAGLYDMADVLALK
jgi:4-hydroxy-tetrahydrodipicolinate reductase